MTDTLVQKQLEKFSPNLALSVKSIM